MYTRASTLYHLGDCCPRWLVEREAVHEERACDIMAFERHFRFNGDFVAYGEKDSPR